MKKQTQNIFGLGVLIVGAFLCYGALEFFSEGVGKARTSEASTQLSSYATAQAAFFEEYKEYGKDTAMIGYSPEGNLRGKLYTSQEQLPNELIQRIPAGSLPFVWKDSYRALLIMDDGLEAKIFSVDQTKTIQQVPLKQ